jgi:hypothetical protein
MTVQLGLADSSWCSFLRGIALQRLDGGQLATLQITTIYAVVARWRSPMRMLWVHVVR